MESYINCLLIDHNDSFTYNISSWLKSAGISVTLTSHNLNPKVDGFDFLLLSPGPKRYSDYPQTTELIRDCQQKIPLVGICLGMQMMLATNGNKIEILPTPCHGKQSLITHNNHPLFEKIKNPITVGRYHSQGSYTHHGFDLLAKDSSEVVMTIINENKMMIGYQFHPESFLTQESKQLALNLKKEIKKWKIF